MVRNRELLLSGLLGILALLSVIILFEILPVVVFAITVAYVLYPLRMQMTKRGVSDRVASSLATSVAFLVVVALLAPIVYVTNQRRGQLIDVLEQIPDTISLGLAGMEFAVETSSVVESAEQVIRDIAVRVALAAPGLALELTVFTFLLYGLLLRPHKIRDAMYALVPASYHDILTRLHERTRSTLYTIYIVQAATAAGTAVIAAIVFLVMGYPAPFTLAVLAGILQFIPILGPTILVAGLAAFDVILGFETRAAVLFVVGLVLIGFVPDAIIRTRFAGRAGEIAASLYFVGFVGGILTIGPIGLIVGPLVVALLVEVVELVSERGRSPQTTLPGTADSDTELATQADNTGNNSE